LVVSSLVLVLAVLAAFSADEGIAYVSSWPAMRDLQTSGKSTHLDCDAHWTRDTHKHAAVLLTDYLIARGDI